MKRGHLQENLKKGSLTALLISWSTCNKIHCQLDNDDEILAVVLDLSKAFDKVWHKGLLYKQKKVESLVNSLNGLNHTCPTGIRVLLSMELNQMCYN